jgi:ankyrin repeat protein
LTPFALPFLSDSLVTAYDMKQNGDSPLHLACLSNSVVDLVELLLRLGADINARNLVRPILRLTD